MVRFGCHVGHAYTAENLLAHHDDAVERSLWVALRTLQVAAALRVDMANRAFARELHALEDAYRRRATELERSAGLIRALLQGGTPARIAADDPLFVAAEPPQ